MPCGVIDEEQHISITSKGHFQGTAYVQVCGIQRLSGIGSCIRSNGLSSDIALDAVLAIALGSHLQSIGNDFPQDLQSHQTDVCQAEEP